MTISFGVYLVLWLTCFVMCGCFDNSPGVLVICVLVCIVLRMVCTVFLYCFVYVYLLSSFVCTSVRTTATE